MMFDKPKSKPISIIPKPIPRPQVTWGVIPEPSPNTQLIPLPSIQPAQINFKLRTKELVPIDYKSSFTLKSGLEYQKRNNFPS